MPELILSFGPAVGLTSLDVALLVGCPIFAALGTTVSAAIKKSSMKPIFSPETELPMSKRGKAEQEMSPEEKLALYNEQRRDDFNRYWGRIKRNESVRLVYIGFVLGLVIALYFVGAITNSVTSLARILGLCVLLGYQAPNLWNLQEGALARLVEKKLKELGR